MPAQNESVGSGTKTVSASARISPTRKWCFRAVTGVLLPLCLFASIELTLRVTGYGFDPSYFIPQEIQGQQKLVTNDDFGRRFFPPQMVRSPYPTVVAPRKPPGTIRIFVFGESAALGDPRPGYGFSRYLQVLLEKRFPETRFEVICAAMTAINSHALLPVARECARLDGDLWIVYAGNNEMLGPFGAARVFGAQTPPLIWIRAHLAAMQFRTGQWLVEIGRNLSRDETEPANWEGMRMFSDSRLAPDDPRRNTVHQNFESNLRSILRIAKRKDVPVIVSRVVSAVREAGPFASAHSSTLTPNQLEEFEGLYQRGLSLQTRGDHSGALVQFDAAHAIDSRHADLQFHRGQALAALGRDQEAEIRWLAARDNDALPFRADAEINRIIEAAATDPDAAHAEPFNPWPLFRDPGSGRMPGTEMLFDHVHFTFTGNYVIARGLAGEAAEWLGLTPSPSPSANDWANREECDRWLAQTAWNRESAYAAMIRRLQVPPFTARAGHDEVLRALNTRLVAIRDEVRATPVENAIRLYETAISSQPDDHQLRENYAEFLEATGNIRGCLSQWETIHEALPNHFGPHYHMGRLMGQLGECDEALPHLRTAFRKRPESPDIRLQIAICLERLDRLAEALAVYRELAGQFPNRSDVRYQMALTLIRLERRSEAIRELRSAVDLRPDDWKARYRLGVEYVLNDEVAPAKEQFFAVTRLNPDHAMAHFNLAVAHARLGDYAAAYREFSKTVELDPDNPSAVRQRELARQLMTESPGKRP